MSLKKFATFQVLSKTLVPKDASPAQLRTLGHRHDFQYAVEPGYLYIRSRAISSRCNDNFDEFPAGEIKKAYKTFIGKPVFVNHNNDNHRRARGVVIDAALHEDKNSDGTPDTWVEVLMMVDAVRFPKLAKAVLAGHIDRTSMGTDVKYSICSTCNNKATAPSEYCFLPGTQITMANGTLKPIERVVAGDRVLTHDGPGIVTAPMVRDYEGDLARIYRGAYAEPLVLTYGHEVMANRVGRRHETKSRAARYASVHDAQNWGWVPSQALGEGNWVQGAYPVEVAETQTDVASLASDLALKDGRATLASVYRSGSHAGLLQYGKNSMPERVSNSDEALGFVLGLYTAEGSMETARSNAGTPKTLQWSLGAHETDIVHDLQLALDKLGAGEVKIYSNLNSNGISVRLSNAPLAALVDQWIGRGAKTKHLSGEIMLAPYAFQRAFLDAYYRGDGWDDPRGHVEVRTVSDLLSRQLVMLGARCDDAIPSWWKNTHNPGGPSNRRALGTVYHLGMGRAGAMNHRRRLHDGYFANQVTKTETEHYHGPVYNFEVAGQNSYVAEGVVVHNCVHIPRMKGKRVYRTTASGAKEGVLIREICHGLSFFENSLLVEEPADPTAITFGVDDRGMKATASLPKTQKCEYGDHPATKRVLHAEGMAYIPVCDAHESKAVSDVGRDEVSAVHTIADDNRKQDRRGKGRPTRSRKQAARDKALATVQQEAAPPAQQSRTCSDCHHDAQRHGRSGCNKCPCSAPQGYGTDLGGGRLRFDGTSHLQPVLAHGDHDTPGTGPYFEGEEEGGSGLHRHRPNGAVSMPGLGCPHCRGGFFTEDARTDHIREQHSGEYSGPSDDMQFFKDRLKEGAASAERFSHYSQGINSVHDADDENFARLTDGGMHHAHCDESHKQRYPNSETEGISFNELRRKLPHGATCDECSDYITEPRHHTLNECEYGEDCEHFDPHEEASSQSDPHGAIEDMRNRGISVDHKPEVPHLPKNHPLSDHWGTDDDLHAEQADQNEWEHTYNSRKDAEGDLGSQINDMFKGHDKAHEMLKSNPTGSTFHSMKTRAIGEIKAPADVDTLRDEECPVCGEHDSYDGNSCQVCGFDAPPQMFREPDLEKAKILDLRKDDLQDAGTLPGQLDAQEQDANGGLPGEVPGSEFAGSDEVPVDPNMVTPEGEVTPTADPAAILQQQMDQLQSGQPLTPDQLGPNGEITPLDPQVDPEAATGHFDQGGEPFTQGPNAPGVPDEPEGPGGPETEGFEPDGQELVDKPGEGEPGTGGDGTPDLACPGCGYVADAATPISLNMNDPNADSGAGDGMLAGDVCPQCQQAQLVSTGEIAEATQPPVRASASAAKGRKSVLGERRGDGPRRSSSMGNRDSLHTALAAQQRTIAALVHQVAVQNLQLTYVARLAGVTKQVEAIRKRADRDNPAQPVDDPPSEQAAETTEQAVAPEAQDDVRRPGMTPGSVNQLAADTTDVALAPGASLPTGPFNQLQNVQAPVAGTETQLPLDQTRIETDVRVGDPAAPGVAFPWQISPNQSNASKASGNRTLAALHLARLQIEAGIRTGDDLAVAASIESSAVSDEEIASTAHTLESVRKAAARQPRPGGLVPRSASVQRTTPSLAGGGLPQSTASASMVSDDVKDADLFF